MEKMKRNIYSPRVELRQIAQGRMKHFFYKFRVCTYPSPNDTSSILPATRDTPKYQPLYLHSLKLVSFSTLTNIRYRFWLVILQLCLGFKASVGNLAKTAFGHKYHKVNFVSLREVLGTLPYLTCLCITEHANATWEETCTVSKSVHDTIIPIKTKSSTLCPLATNLPLPLDSIKVSPKQ